MSGQDGESDLCVPEVKRLLGVVVPGVSPKTFHSVPYCVPMNRAHGGGIRRRKAFLIT